MDASNELYGWETLYRFVEKDITRKEHILVLLIHWYLTKEKFRCVGLGDDRTLLDSDPRSELLPDGWSSLERLALRYVYNGELYILHGEFIEGTAIFNLLKVSTLQASNVIFNIGEAVHNIRGSLSEILPQYNSAIDNIKKSLVDPVSQGGARDSSSQTSAEPQRHPPPEYIDPLMVGPPRLPPRQPVHPDFGQPMRPDFVRDINEAGRRDLDPLGIGPNPGYPGAGPEIFDPFHPGFPGRSSHTGLIPGGVGRGAIPPGARFDPFGPIDPTPRPRTRPPPPDSDHFPPPDGYEDMFS